MSTDRFRIRFTFWLDILKEQEAQLAKIIDKLKEERLFAQTIRDGIRLICDLRDGNLDVLFELFPWVRAEFLKYMEDVQPKPTKTALAPDVEKYLQEILEKLDTQQPTPTGLKTLTQNNSGIKQLGGLQPIAPPKFDDDGEDEVLLTVTKATGDGSATQNFLASMMALQQ